MRENKQKEYKETMKLCFSLGNDTKRLWEAINRFKINSYRLVANLKNGGLGQVFFDFALSLLRLSRKYVTHAHP